MKVQKNKRQATNLLGILTIIGAIGVGIAIVAVCSLLPAYLLMILMVQFGITKPLWVWWLVIFFAGMLLKPRVTVNHNKR